MLKQLFTTLLVILCISSTSLEEKGPYQITSPNGKNKITFQLRDGVPTYSVAHNDEVVLDTSNLGFVFKNKDSLNGNFEVLNSEEISFDESWEQVWGEKRTIRDHYNQLAVTLQEKSGAKRKLEIQFRAFDKVGNPSREIQQKTQINIK